MVKVGIVFNGFLDQILENRKVIDQGTIVLRDVVWIVEVVFPINKRCEVIWIGEECFPLLIWSPFFKEVKCFGCRG